MESIHLGRQGINKPSTTTTDGTLLFLVLSTIYLPSSAETIWSTKPWLGVACSVAVSRIEWNVKMYMEDMIETRFIDNRP